MSIKLDLDNHYPLYLSWAEMPVWKEFHYFSRILGTHLSESSCKILQYEAEIAYDEGRIWEFLQDLPERIKEFRRGTTYKKTEEGGISKAKRDKLLYFRKEYKKETGADLSIQEALPLFDNWYANKLEERKKTKQEKLITANARRTKKLAYNKGQVVLSKVEKFGYETVVALNIYTNQIKQFDTITNCSRFLEVSSSHIYKSHDDQLIVRKEWLVKIFGR